MADPPNEPQSIMPRARPPYGVDRSTVNNEPVQSITVCPKCGCRVPGIRLWEHGFGHRYEDGAA